MLRHCADHANRYPERREAAGAGLNARGAELSNAVLPLEGLEVRAPPRN